MDVLLERIFKSELDENETKTTKFNELSEKIFKENVRVEEENGKRRFVVKLNRLPPEFYPSVNGRDYLNQVIARNKKLEDNLERYQGKKKEFHAY